MDTVSSVYYQVSSYKLYLSVEFSTVLWILCDAIVIQTNHGPVKGYESNVDSVSINIFKNIPYAKSPTGNLRFELPEDVDSWLDHEDLRQEDDILCPQPSTNRHGKMKKRDSFMGQEDCLHLDVYVRNNSETADLRPVLIYFHAGMFSYGSKNEYHPEFLLSLHDIIVVIPNYRLGILGFLSGVSSEHPANLGLWDQRKCMEWVHKNIESFGGDRNRVIISGHDAGGASVGFHILSPKSHRFFSGAISGSGTVLDPWVFGRPRTAAISAVEQKIGCHQNFSDVMTCLKMSDLNKLLRTQITLKKDQFLPTVDGHLKHSFIQDTPQKLYQMGYQKNVSYLAGVTRNESSLEINRHFHEALKHKHLDSIAKHLLEPHLRGSPELSLIAKAAKYHYLRRAQIPTFESVKPQMEMMLNDFLYNSPLHTTLSLHSVRTQLTYMYVFAFDNGKSPLGVTHMEDAFYIFNKTLEKSAPEINNETANVRTLLCDVWGNFVKSKLPGDSSVWKTFRSKHQTNYVEITESSFHKLNYRCEAMEFWNLLIPDLIYYHNLSTEKPKREPFQEDPSYTAWGLAGLAILMMALCVSMVGVVTVARRRYTQSSILPISSTRENVQYSKVT